MTEIEILKYLAFRNGPCRVSAYDCYHKCQIQLTNNGNCIHIYYKRMERSRFLLSKYSKYKKLKEAL